MRQLHLALVSIILLLAVLACGPAASPTPAAPTSAPATTSASSPVAATAPTVGAANTVAPSGSTPAATDRNYTVRIGYPATVRSQPAPVGPDVWALNQGLFDAEFKADGISVQFVPFLAAGPAMNEAMTGGSLDLSSFADTPAIIAKAGGVDMSLVGVADATGSAWLIVRGPSSYQKVTDLKGKKVATIKGTFPHLFLVNLLKANGMSPSDIELVNMNFADSETALHASQVDAIISPGANGLRLQQAGDRAIYSTDDLPSSRGTSVIVAANSFIKAHPSFFSRYFKVRAQAIAWANANRAAALDQLATASGAGTDAALMGKLYPGPTFPFDPPITPEIVDHMKGTDAFLRDAGLTRESVDFQTWISPLANKNQLSQ